MFFFAPHSIPIFLTRRLYEPRPPCLKAFDVFYIFPPVVGLDIVGMEDNYPPCSLGIEGIMDCDETVIGFYVRPPVVGLEIDIEEPQCTFIPTVAAGPSECGREGVVGFYARSK